MFLTSKSDVYKWAIIFLLVLILFMDWLGFLILDKKIDRALEQQGEVNQCVYDTDTEQSKSIRLLQTDSDIILRLLLSKEYLEGEEE